MEIVWRPAGRPQLISRALDAIPRTTDQTPLAAWSDITYDITWCGGSCSKFEFCLSVALFLEYESALKRPEAGIALSVAAIDDVLDHLAAVGRHQEIFFLWRPSLPDPADDHVLELAVAGRCDAIVTYNRRDFRGAEQFGMRIVSPPDFLLELRSEEP